MTNIAIFITIYLVRKYLFIYIFSSILALFCLYQSTSFVFAEQSGSSPESGSTSHIKYSYDLLVTKGTNYGSSTVPDWTLDWGTYWNRLMNSGLWKTDGTATAANVLANTTFYLGGSSNRTQTTGTMTARTGDTASSAQAASGGLNYFTPLAGYYSGTDRVSATNAQVAALSASLVTGNVKSGVTIFGVPGNSNVVDTSSGTAGSQDITSGKIAWVGGTQITGTASAAPNYTSMSLFNWDDGKGTETYGESTWTNTAGTATTGVWKDSRTGLYWSNTQGALTTNIFPNTDHSTCDFFSTNPRGNYDGSDADCGIAINRCGALTLAAGGTSSTDWYLPSQQELMQAYIDGMYNQTNTTFASTNQFWSSTEHSGNSSNAWFVILDFGFTNTSGKSNGSFAVRCVRRD